MKFLGWSQETEEPNMPLGGWTRPAFNAVLNLDGLSLSQEASTQLRESFDKVIGYIQTPKDIIFFTKIATRERIYVYRDEILSVHLENVSTEYELFTLVEGIQGVYKYNEAGDLVICWWDGVSTSSKGIYILNIDTLPYPVDGNNRFIDAFNYDKLKLYPQYNTASIKLDDSLHGDLPTGSYQFAVQYEITSVDFTNLSALSMPIYLYKQHNTLQGENSQKSIKVSVRNLDQRFQFFRLVVYRQINNAVEVKEVGRYVINNTVREIVYNNTHSDRVISLEQFLINREVYEKAYTGTVFDSELYLGQVVSPSINYQQYANNIKVVWRATDLDEEQEVMNSEVVDEFNIQPKGKISANLKGLLPDEVYAFYIRWIFKNGAKSEAFHIPGRESSFIPDYIKYEYPLISKDYNGGSPFFTMANDLGITILIGQDVIVICGGLEFKVTNITVGVFTTMDVEPVYASGLSEESFNQIAVNTITIIKYDPNDSEVELLDTYGHTGNSLEIQNTSGESVRYFHMKNEGASGRMAYWENKNEYYPSNKPEFTEVYDKNGITVDNLSNKPVRHHKTPSLWHIYHDVATGDKLNRIIKPALFDVAYTNEVLEKCIGYEVLYAKRTQENKQVVSYCTVLAEYFDRPDDGVDYPLYRLFDTANPLFRAYSFDLGATFPSLGGLNYINNQFVLRGIKQYEFKDSGDPGMELEIKQRLNSNDPFRVKNPSYIPYNNSVVEPQNVQREDCLRFKTSPSFAIAAYNATVYEGYLPSAGLPFTGTFSEVIMACIKVFRVDVYMTFVSQELVSCGSNIILDPAFAGEYISSISEDIGVFDTFLYQDHVRYAESTQANSSISERGWNGESPNTSFPTRIEFRNYGTAPYGLITELLPNLSAFQPRGIHPDYLTLNTQFSGTVKNFEKESDGYNSFLIIHSTKQGGQLQENWRNILTNNRYDKITNKGAVTGLFTFDSYTLGVHYKDSLFLAKIIDKLATEETEVFLGAGKLFESPLMEIYTSEESVGLLDSRFSFKMTPKGYVFASDGRIYFLPVQANNQKASLQELSYPIRNYARRNLNKIVVGIDNPYDLTNSQVIIFGYDHSYERLLVTRTFDTNVSLTKRSTVSYSFINNAWIGRHSYYPQMYINYKRDLLGLINNNTTGQLFRHHSPIEFHNYYDRWTEEFFVDLVFAGAKDQPFILESVRWTNKAYNSATNVNSLNRHTTFTKIMLYNHKQCSGYIDLYRPNVEGITSWFNANLNHNNDFWSFNDFMDCVVDKDEPFLDSEHEPNANINQLMAWFKKLRFESTWVAVRFVFFSEDDRIAFHEASITTTIE